jgi:putative membrane-bound dehydrogenase-like protein
MMNSRVWMLALALPLAASARQESGPLGPKEASRSFRLPEGFRIDLVAAEPHVMDPVALAFDEDGRIYVAEMADYPLGPPSGRIKLLEDADGDGRVDKASLFVERIPFPKGVMPWRGGVLVTAAPDILFFKDTDGDGKADVREVVFTGFVEGNQQHRANGLQFGIDNWIYGANGDSGGNLRRPEATDGKRISLRGTDYRFRPDYSGLESVAGQSQFANTFDDWGNRFFNNNSDHIRHAPIALGYLGRNPQLSVSAVLESVSDHGGASRVFPVSKLQERPNDYAAAGHFTSACSVTIYRGGRFGPEYPGNAFTCEPVHNLVHRDVLAPKGASFTARRAPETAEFLASTDPWFRPVNLAVGPDGALYVADFYRLIVEHPQWIPLEMQRRYDLRAGHDRGRIWRVAPEDLRSVKPGLGGAAAGHLVAHFENANAWWRMTAQRLIIERQDKAAVAPLKALLRDSKSALARLHALWTLEGLGALEPGEVERALRDSEPGVRSHALRLAEPRIGALREAVLALRDDPSARVRFQLALTLGEVRDERALDALAKVALQDAEDRWVRLAVLSSIPGQAAKLLARLRGSLETPRPGSMELVRQLADLAGASRKEEQVVEWLQVLASGAGAEPSRWRLVALSALGPSLRRWGVNLEGLLRKSGTEKQVSEWTARLAEGATDPSREVAERVNAIDLLAMLPSAEALSRLEGLMKPQEPQEVQVAVVRALAPAPGNPVGTRLVEGWLRYTAAVRREILAVLFARPDQVPGVLDRLEKGSIRVVELEAHHRDALLKHSTRDVRERARKLFAAKSATEIDEVVDKLFAKMEPLKPDPVGGEKVYQQHCMTCHRLHGQGYDVGPNLASVAGREKKALLTDILNPNRAIAPQYQVYVVKTPAAEMVSGMIAAETPASITLRRAMADQTTVARKDILEIKAWPASMMPEGLENNLTAQNFADLLEYLQKGGTSVRPPGPKSFEGNRPAVVKPGPDGVLVLPATAAEVHGATLVFEAKYGNLGYWSSEGDQAVWSIEAAREGRYAVELDWACDAANAGNAYVLVAGDARLSGKVESTGSWDAYRQARVGTVEIKAGVQKVALRSAGRINGALLDLRTLRLVPAKE